jgi:hypothetical protein
VLQCDWMLFGVAFLFSLYHSTNSLNTLSETQLERVLVLIEQFLGKVGLVSWHAVGNAVHEGDCQSVSQSISQ